MISAARSSGARSDVLERITHNARGAIIDIYTAWEWPALCEAVSCLKVDPDRCRDGFMTFLMTYTFLRTLTRGNHCACLVEAVGIQQLAVHLIVVPEYARGLEYVQGRLSRVLEPGRYAVWT